MTGFFSSESVQIQRPGGSLLPKCGACGLYKKCESPKMVPHGDGARKVLIVGEAPGTHEDESGRPFTGNPGQYLKETLGRLGVKLERDCLLTNSIICKPHGELADLKQVNYCRPNLLETIRTFEPQVIVTLGRSALVSVVQDYWKESVGPLERWVGWKIPLGVNKIGAPLHWLCPTYHPSFLLRSHNNLMERLFSDHLEAAFEIEEPPPVQEDFSRQIECLYDEEAIYEGIKEIHQTGGWVAVDYETNCLKPNYPEARIYSCALSNGEKTIAYPWRGVAIEATKRLLASDRTHKIASNLKMEERWTCDILGVPVNNWGWDTMLAAHCLDNRQEISGLKFQALVKLGVPSYNDYVASFLESEERYNTIHKANPSSILFYNGMDALLEHRLAMVQRKEMGFED